MFGRENLHYHWDPYPRKLSFQAAATGTHPALLEPDGKVRLAVALQKGCQVAFRTAGKDAALDVQFDVQQGNCVDLLVPMIPTGQDLVEKECSLGYEKALAQADAYWRPLPETAATIEVPEQQVTQAIRHYVKLAEVVAEKDPATGDYANLTGAWTYADVWSTPSAMTLALLLDPMGYHPQADALPGRVQEVSGQHRPAGEIAAAASGLSRHAQSLSADQLAFRQRGAALGVFRACPAFGRRGVHRGVYAGHHQVLRVDTRRAGVEPATAASKASCPRPWLPTRASRCSRSGTTAGTTRG